MNQLKCYYFNLICYEIFIFVLLSLDAVTSIFTKNVPIPTDFFFFLAILSLNNY